ncbi:MAG: hypothetical protein WC742_07130 [Gallionellaceae bacterium]|jgi:hypothetical protein
MLAISQRPTILGLRQFLYLKVGTGLVVLSALAYILYHKHDIKSFGGTWLGYVLGIIGALIILLLLWYGVRKRVIPRQVSPDSGAENSAPSPRKRFKRSAKFALQDWLSSHVYLGLALPIIVTLHSGFQFGINLSTLTYLLMLGVIVSGLYGLYVSMNYPGLLTQNSDNSNLAALFSELEELDEVIRQRAVDLPEESRIILNKSCELALQNEGLKTRLTGIAVNCPNAAAIRHIHKIYNKNNELYNLEGIKEIYTTVLHKDKLLLRIRTELMLMTRMRIWRYLHIPFSLALLAALLAHIFSVIYFW